MSTYRHRVHMLVPAALRDTANTLSIHFGSAQYTTGGAAETARDTLTANGWTIIDGGTA